MLINNPTKSSITTVFNSLLEREGEDPIIKGNKSKGSLIRSTFNPINISSEKGKPK